MRFMFMIVFALLASCKQGSSFVFHADESLPFGVWSAGEGRVILIDRELSFALCDKTQCESGKIRRSGVFGVHLIGFWKMLSARSLHKENAEIGPDFDFTESGVGPEIRNNECRGRPCVFIGALDDSHLTFVKIEDW